MSDADRGHDAAQPGSPGLRARPTRDGSVVVNIGPSHPATHGTIQIIAALDGEKVMRADVHCGYLHRGFEKECEAHTWHNLIPYVDRLNYCSALINDFAYCDGGREADGDRDHAALPATCARCSPSTRASPTTSPASPPR